MTEIAIFEDRKARKFLPLVYTRPVWALRPGMYSLRVRAERTLKRRIRRVTCRDEIVPLTSHRLPHLVVNDFAGIEGALLLLNARNLGYPQPVLELLGEKNDRQPDRATMWLSGGDVLAAWCPEGYRPTLSNGIPEWDDFEEVRLDPFPMLDNLAQLITHVGDHVMQDALLASHDPLAQEPSVAAGVIMEHREAIFLHEGATVGPGAILNAREGPIVIDRGAHILDGAILRGPCYIGPSTQVKSGARLSAVSIGRQCRVGGEVSKSVVQGFANKSHDGYLGNSYLGAWCNIGADTNTSNLRNDYGEISLFDISEGTYLPTGERFVGLIMGDHSKSGINTMFNTGTIVGVGCSVFGPGYQPRHISSFSWGGRGRMSVQRPEHVIETARIVMARRGEELSEEETTLLRQIFEEVRPSG